MVHQESKEQRVLRDPKALKDLPESLDLLDLLVRKEKTDPLDLPATLVVLVTRETRVPKAETDLLERRENEVKTVCRENVARLVPEASEEEWEGLGVLASLDLKETQDSQGLLVRWESKAFLGLRDPEVLLVRLDYLAFLVKMDRLDRQERGDPLESTGPQGHRETQE